MSEVEKSYGRVKESSKRAETRTVQNWKGNRNLEDRGIFHHNLAKTTASTASPQSTSH